MNVYVVVYQNIVDGDMMYECFYDKDKAREYADDNKGIVRAGTLDEETHYTLTRNLNELFGGSVADVACKYETTNNEIRKYVTFNDQTHLDRLPVDDEEISVITRFVEFLVG